MMEVEVSDEEDDSSAKKNVEQDTDANEGDFNDFEAMNIIEEVVPDSAAHVDSVTEVEDFIIETDLAEPMIEEDGLKDIDLVEEASDSPEKNGFSDSYVEGQKVSETVVEDFIVEDDVSFENLEEVKDNINETGTTDEAKEAQKKFQQKDAEVCESDDNTVENNENSVRPDKAITHTKQKQEEDKQLVSFFQVLRIICSVSHRRNY